jgi:hypothetical protein
MVFSLSVGSIGKGYPLAPDDVPGAVFADYAVAGA